MESNIIANFANVNVLSIVEYLQYKKKGKMQTNPDMVWYACYGSNMDLNRFLIYIQGGQLVINGQVKTYRACENDIQPPINSEPYLIQRRFYFAKESGTWNNRGVGFISAKSNKRSLTYARLYLISKNQFSHLFASENGRRTSTINYEQLCNTKLLDFDYNFYNRVLQLNENYKGYPIITFTNKDVLPLNYPMDEYLRLISNGLKITHKLSNKDIAEYFSKSKIGLSRKTILTILNPDK